MKELSVASQVVTPSPIREMFNRAIGMEDVVSFTVGEPDFQTPAHIVEAAVEALRRGEHKYTPNAGILPLRQAISKHTEATHGLTYEPEGEIIVTAGGMEALYLTMITLLNPGDELILGDPCWTNYSRQVLLCNAEPKFVTVTADNDFLFDADALEAAITPKTKAFLVNSPANPTGGVGSRAGLGQRRVDGGNLRRLRQIRQRLMGGGYALLDVVHVLRVQRGLPVDPCLFFVCHNVTPLRTAPRRRGFRRRRRRSRPRRRAQCPDCR